jgi:hypothetical protein
MLQAWVASRVSSVRQSYVSICLRPDLVFRLPHTRCRYNESRDRPRRDLAADFGHVRRRLDLVTLRYFVMIVNWVEHRHDGLYFEPHPT